MQNRINESFFTKVRICYYLVKNIKHNQMLSMKKKIATSPILRPRFILSSPLTFLFLNEFSIISFKTSLAIVCASCCFLILFFFAILTPNNRWCFFFCHFAFNLIFFIVRRSEFCLTCSGFRDCLNVSFRF
jgi:hypothetical protein